MKHSIVIFLITSQTSYIPPLFPDKVNSHSINVRPDQVRLLASVRESELALIPRLYSGDCRNRDHQSINQSSSTLLMNTLFPLLMLSLLLFVSLLQCFDFTIAPICHVLLFKSFIMTQNNDVENFFLICSKGRPTFDANFKAIDCCYQVK